MSTRFCHEYLPTGKICEVFEGVCFGTFATAADALAWEAVSVEKEYRGFYRIVPLPADLRDGCEEGRLANEALEELQALRLTVPQKAQRLTGPRGGEISRSHFQRVHVAHKAGDADNAWQWVAYTPDGAVYMIMEYPDDLLPFHCDRAGALWSIREAAADFFHFPRCHRGH